MIVVWTYIGARGIGLNKIVENGKIHSINYKLIMAWIIILLIFQIILRPGIVLYSSVI
jgi:hypothetical protein